MSTCCLAINNIAIERVNRNVCLGVVECLIKLKFKKPILGYWDVDSDAQNDKWLFTRTKECLCTFLFPRIILLRMFLACRCSHGESYKRRDISSSACEFMPQFWTLLCSRQPFPQCGAVRLCLCWAFYGEYSSYCPRTNLGCLVNCKPVDWEVLHGCLGVFSGFYWNCKPQVYTPTIMFNVIA